MGRIFVIMFVFFITANADAKFPMLVTKYPNGKTEELDLSSLSLNKNLKVNIDQMTIEIERSPAPETMRAYGYSVKYKDIEVFNIALCSLDSTKASNAEKFRINIKDKSYTILVVCNIQELSSLISK